MTEPAPTMTELKALVDHASSQSDRWLFIALLVIGMLAIYALAKYFTAQIEALASKYEALNKFVRDEHMQIIGNCTDALHANTRALARLKLAPSDPEDDEVTARTYPAQRPTHA